MISTTILAVITIVALIAFLGRKIIVPNRLGFNGPPALPFIGSVLELRKHNTVGKQYRLLGDWIQKYGGKEKLISVALPAGQTLVATADPDLAKFVFNKPEFFGLNTNFRDAFAAVTPGLLVLEDNVWKRHRRLVQAAFFPAPLRYVLQVTNDECDKAFSLWETRGELNLHQCLSAFALDVVAKSSFGIELDAVCSDKYKSFQHAVEVSTEEVEKRIIIPPFMWRLFGFDQASLERTANVIRSEITQALTQRLKQSKAQLTQDAEIDSDSTSKKDLMDMLIAATGDGDQPLTDTEVVDEVIMFFLAGHETSSNTLCWALYELAKHPECVAKIQEEVDRVLGPDGVPAWEDLSNFKYIDMVLKEGLRIHSTVPVSGREVVQEVEIAGRTLPKGTLVACSFHSIHKDPVVYPNPEVFDPERWRDESKSATMPFFPFGYGPRTCVGKKMAWLEMQVVLARFFQKYTFTLRPNQQVEEIHSITLGPKRGLFGSIVARTS